MTLTSTDHTLYNIIEMGRNYKFPSVSTMNHSASLPIEPRSWDLQSTRLGYHQIIHFIGFSPISLDVYITCSLDNPFVKGTAMFSLDFT